MMNSQQRFPTKGCRTTLTSATAIWQNKSQTVHNSWQRRTIDFVTAIWQNKSQTCSQQLAHNNQLRYSYLAERKLTLLTTVDCML
jgi:hypothetical protein